MQFCRGLQCFLLKRNSSSLLQSLNSCVRHKTNVCIVGSGPAGFYTAEVLLKDPDVHVDIVEKLPVPFGLIRYGVAPDHPEIKNAINKFHSIAEGERCNFYGNIDVGKDVSLKELLGVYNAVVLAYGAAEGRTLGIPGEDSPNVFSARQIVGWYNGAPENAEENVNLDTEVAAVIGHGNVAIDVARILLRNVEELGKTDITEHALCVLKKSRIRKVVLVGRRGPLQVAFTIKELRELTKLSGCGTFIDPQQMQGVQELLPSIQRPRKRLTELLVSTSQDFQKSHNPKEVEIKFYCSPKAIVCDHKDRTEGIVVGINKPEGSLSSNQVISTGEEEMISCGLVVRSVGYKSVKIDPLVPFDEKKGIVPNDQGRAASTDALYCSGWLKSGPVGVIPSTMRNSYETGSKLLSDLKQGVIPSRDLGGSNEILPLLKKRDVLVTTYDHWKKIDSVEVQRGLAAGKPREKIWRTSEMFQIAGLL